MGRGGARSRRIARDKSLGSLGDRRQSRHLRLLSRPRSGRQGTPGVEGARGPAISLLALQGLEKRYGGIRALSGAGFSIDKPGIVGLIGPNGAGKTTLFGMITGTITPDAGRVVYDGRDISRDKPEHRCRVGIARSFQIPQPFGGMTVFENLVVAAAFGGGQRESDVYARCAELLEQCGLADKANRRAGSLTLLDRKRLELARALATKPRVLLLDEVAGGLIEHETAALVDLVRQVRATGVSIVWIEHIVHALKIANNAI